MTTWIMLMLHTIVMVESSSSLRLLQLLYRHGDRTPSHTFPNDPYRDKWTEGVEMLTRLGMEQHFDFGKYLRERYHDFIPEEYTFNDTLVRSTDNDRTILSAQAQLQGLYPKTYAPKGGYPFTSLIPIHTVPKPNDQLMKMTSPCPAYKKLWKEMQKSALWKKLEAENRVFFEKLAVVAGYSYVGLVRSFYIGDVVNVWLCHNLTLPSWVTPDVITRLAAMLDLKQYLRYYTPEMQRLRGGPLVGLVTQRMIAKINGTSLERRRLLYSYSAHDSTLSAFLSVLGLFNRRKPPYVACVFLELHGKGNSSKLEDHFIRVFYKNETHKPPMLLTIPGCETDCPLITLQSLIKDKVPADIESACGLPKPLNLSKLLPSNSMWILTTTLVGIATIATFYYCRFFGRQSRK